jgi:glycosyltransferase involved in cell wall biosynthesis
MQNSNIKIVLFTDTFCDANGVSRFLQDMSKEAKKDQKEFHIITSTAKDYCDKLENVNVLKPIFKMKMPFYKELDIVFPPYFKMKKMLKELKPDVIHVSTPGFIGICGVLLAKKHKIPLVGTYHTDFPMYIYKNTKSTILKNITKGFLKYFYKDFSAIVTRSREYIDVINEDIKKQKDEIHFLQPGTNISTFSPRYKNEDVWSKLNISPESLKFLYVGRASKEKNLDTLFEIWKEFYNKSTNKKSHLIIVGSGDLTKHKDELKRYNVEFLGHKQKEELSSIYASSSTFVFPSTTDTLGQVVLESMASGIPSIVTTIGGPRGIVEGSQKDVGIVLDIENKSSWVDTLIKIENSEVDLKEMGENAFEYSQNFSITNTFKSFYNINKSALS